MMSKRITLLAQTGIFNNDICEWRQKNTDKKAWEKYKLLFQRSHQEPRIAATAEGKGGYTVTAQKIYGAPPTPPEEHHEAIDYIQTIL